MNKKPISTPSTTSQTQTSRSEARPGETDHGRMVKTIYKVMVIDYGAAFTKIFKDGMVTPKAWMGRLYRALKGFDLDCIAAAFESLIAANREYPPKPGEIIAESKRRHLSKRDVMRYRKADGPLSVQDIPVTKYLEQLKSEPEKETKSLNDLLVSHEEMIMRHKKEGKVVTVRHHADAHCATIDCDNYGTVSSSVTGTNAWYCMDCYQQRLKLG